MPFGSWTQLINDMAINGFRRENWTEWTTSYGWPRMETISLVSLSDWSLRKCWTNFSTCAWMIHGPRAAHQSTRHRVEREPYECICCRASWQVRRNFRICRLHESGSTLRNILRVNRELLGGCWRSRHLGRARRITGRCSWSWNIQCTWWCISISRDCRARETTERRIQKQGYESNTSSGGVTASARQNSFNKSTQWECFSVKFPKLTFGTTERQVSSTHEFDKLLTRRVRQRPMWCNSKRLIPWTHSDQDNARDDMIWLGHELKDTWWDRDDVSDSSMVKSPGDIQCGNARCIPRQHFVGKHATSVETQMWSHDHRLQCPSCVSGGYKWDEFHEKRS